MHYLLESRFVVKTSGDDLTQKKGHGGKTFWLSLIWCLGISLDWTDQPSGGCLNLPKVGELGSGCGGQVLKARYLHPRTIELHSFKGGPALCKACGSVFGDTPNKHR
ncbi:hypothetical protein AMTR_s00036p00181270 [Amborella trichopoda]|uniref:Uncharacterized protein n=1 Tax=Amborella trichopoda TaxID=13333 RepID=U5CYW8_AMBTC|nr:hypothetical protein AMTR_s00036p00181270 [Amborella trichopoda]